MTPTLNKRTRSNDEVEINDTSTRKTKTRASHPRNNIFHSLGGDTTGEILSFLKMNDIGTFRIASKYFCHSTKMSYTKEHCEIIANSLIRIYSNWTRCSHLLPHSH
mmetsp:Transcript_45696/g.55464  ORF Transcript_45696/g.55464 Transcript_45696/m.55464 type:complete len:106 (+) Transcript_45696:182-499(+)